MFTKPTGMEQSFTLKGKLEDEELNKVTGGEGRTGHGWTDYYCPKVEDDDTFRTYLFYTPRPNNGCPHFKAEEGETLHRCSCCVYLVRE